MPENVPGFSEIASPEVQAVLEKYGLLKYELTTEDQYYISNIPVEKFWLKILYLFLKKILSQVKHWRWYEPDAIYHIIQVAGAERDVVELPIDDTLKQDIYTLIVFFRRNVNNEQLRQFFPVESVYKPHEYSTEEVTHTFGQEETLYTDQAIELLFKEGFIIGSRKYPRSDQHSPISALAHTLSLNPIFREKIDYIKDPGQPSRLKITYEGYQKYKAYLSYKFKQSAELDELFGHLFNPNRTQLHKPKENNSEYMSLLLIRSYMFGLPGAALDHLDLRRKVLRDRLSVTKTTVKQRLFSNDDSFLQILQEIGTNTRIEDAIKNLEQNSAETQHVLDFLYFIITNTELTPDMTVDVLLQRLKNYNQDKDLTEYYKAIYIIPLLEIDDYTYRGIIDKLTAFTEGQPTTMTQSPPIIALFVKFVLLAHQHEIDTLKQAVNDILSDSYSETYHRKTYKLEKLLAFADKLRSSDLTQEQIDYLLKLETLEQEG